MEIKEIKINEIKPNPKNPKKHKTGLIAKSIEEMGYIEPIVVDENDMILAGHGRLKALKELKKEEVEVIVKRGLTEKQKEKYLLLSNKLVEKGGWDKDLLKEFDEELLGDAGWESEEIDDIMDEGVEEDEFDADKEYEKIKEPKVKLGDLYQLGNHRLLCGDATKKEDVEKLMGSEKADMVFTDPPYNVNYSGRGKETSSKIMMDNQSQEEFINKKVEKLIGN